MLRRVHGTRAVGTLYGQRALLVQATDPLAFAGLMANTDGLDAPFRRLARTAQTMERVFFGSRDEADAVTARVRRMHSRVRGELDEPAGRYPAGSEYSADSPEFLLWILACLADSALAVYERLVCSLDADERERFWADYVLLGELFGLERAEAPADSAEFRASMDERLRGDDLHVIEQAYEIGRRVAFDLPLPASRAPALPLINFLVIGLLPKRVRDLYGIDWSIGRQVAYDGLCYSLRAGARLSPAALRRGPTSEVYDLVARTERERLRRPAA
jgi:uncharacterized protein (DUF2236 family)